jgi:hypothetical protein
MKTKQAILVAEVSKRSFTAHTTRQETLVKED